MDGLNAVDRRRAEDAATRALDEPGAASIPGASATRLGPAAGSLYVHHLFVHGLMASLAEEMAGTAAETRHRRVMRVMGAIRAGGVPGGVPRRRFRRTALGRTLAAAAMLLIAAGAIVIAWGGGLEARAAVRHALDRVDDGRDRVYHGRLVLDWSAGAESLRREFRFDFTTRGRDRLVARVELPLGPLGPVPVRLGRVGDAFWTDVMGLGPQRVDPRRLPLPLGGDPLEDLTNLGRLLALMEARCELSWAAIEEGGPLRVVGVPSGGGSFPMRALERVLVEVDRENHEVRALEVRLKPSTGGGARLALMAGVPARALLDAVTIRLAHVKNCEAPDATYWPVELGDPEDEG